MRAVSSRGPSRLRVVDKPEPALAHDGVAAVRVTRAAIRGSDLQALGPGDRVVPFDLACGACCSCQRGLGASRGSSNSSSDLDLVGVVYGHSHTMGGYEGGQAQYASEGVDDEAALFLSDALPAGYQDAEMGRIAPGQTVVVFGCGPVGLLAQKSAGRLDFARRHPAAALGVLAGATPTRARRS